MYFIQCTLCTLHHSMMIHCTLYMHGTSYILRCIMYQLQCTTVYIILFNVLNIIQCIVHIVHCTLIYNCICIVHSVHCTLYSVRSNVYHLIFVECLIRCQCISPTIQVARLLSLKYILSTLAFKYTPLSTFLLAC